MKIRKIWTGLDNKKRPIVVYYMDEEGVSVRKFGKPEYEEGQECDVVMNDKGFFDFDLGQKKAEAPKPTVQTNGSVQASIMRMSALKSAVDYCKGTQFDVQEWAERFEKWLNR